MLKSGSKVIAVVAFVKHIIHLIAATSPQIVPRNATNCPTARPR